MHFDADAFISYSHLDNVELVQGRQGWVANLQRALAIRVAQMLGKEARVWWDAKLQGNDVFDLTLVDRLHKVAALVSIVSPRYVRSEWGRKEVVEFCKAAGEQGGIRVQDKARLFKVLKTDVPLADQPEELRSMLGYEFFKIDPGTGKIRELNEIFGADAERDFWLKLDDLAHDVCTLLNTIECAVTLSGTASASTPSATPAAAPSPAASSGFIYLAETTTDLRDEREGLRRDLEQHGFRVLPDHTLPVQAADLEKAVREYLAQCRMSIHLVGQTYSLVPEGSPSSLIELQNELAIARAAGGGFSRLVWMPPGLAATDDRQRALIDKLRLDPRDHEGADLLETPLEDLRTLIHARLEDTPKPPDAVVPAADAASDASQVYLICDERDLTAIKPWSDFLFQKYEVIRSMFDGDEAEIREYQDESLRTCDAVVIFYGAGNELWLRRKLREVQKSVGYGRTKPRPAVAICLIPPRTPEKEQFRTHEAIVIPQWDGVSPDAWQPFVARLTGTGEGRRSNAG